MTVFNDVEKVLKGKARIFFSFYFLSTLSAPPPPGHNVSTLTGMKGPFQFISSSFLCKYVKSYPRLYLAANAQARTCLVHGGVSLTVLKARRFKVEVPRGEIWKGLASVPQKASCWCLSRGYEEHAFMLQKGFKALIKQKQMLAQTTVAQNNSHARNVF